LRYKINRALDRPSKIEAIKTIRVFYPELSLRESKTVIDIYAIRYQIEKKLIKLKKRINHWVSFFGEDKLDFQSTQKSQDGLWTHKPNDLQFIQNHLDALPRQISWLPKRKSYQIYNELWKKYK
tara:strand:+ start:354 stop:725 length:372 start_codon:yes stop_codon:yes gene_type:complete